MWGKHPKQRQMDQRENGPGRALTPTRLHKRERAAHARKHVYVVQPKRTYRNKTEPYRVPTWIDPPEIRPMTSMDVSPVTDFGGGLFGASSIVARVTQTL